MIKILTRIDDLKEISSEWTTLASKSSVSPFQYPDWLIPWYLYFGQGDLISYAVFENNELVFLAPVFLRKLKGEPRKVVFIGTGNSDYLDVLCLPGEENKYLPRFYDYLYSIRNEYDEIDFMEVNESSPLLKHDITKFFKSRITEGEICHRISIPGSYEEFLSMFSKNRIKNLNRMERKLAAGDGFIFEEADEYNYEEFLSESAELNNKRWGNGVLNSNTVIGFNNAVIKNLISKGSVHLFRIRNGSRTIAVEYVLEEGDIVYDYIHSNNPEYEKYSPGFLMRLKTIEYFISKGKKTFDFLRGDEAYKKIWDTCVTRNYRIQITI